MINVSIHNAKDNLDKLSSICIRQNDVAKIKTKDGNVFLLSENSYNNLVETLSFLTTNGVYKDIEEAVKTPTSEFSKQSPFN